MPRKKLHKIDTTFKTSPRKSLAQLICVYALLAQNAKELLQLCLKKKNVVHKLLNNADHEITEFVNWYLQELHVGKFIFTLILFSHYTYSDLTRVNVQ
jgi:hypothetical protein